MFCFLPLSMLLYITVQKRMRLGVVCFVSLVFLVINGLQDPAALIIFAVIFSAAYIFGFVAVKLRNAENRKAANILSYIISLVIVSLYFFLRFVFRLRTGEQEWIFIIHSGAMTPLFAVSYYYDIYKRKVEKPATFFGLLLYLSFYPLTVIGPVVEYSDFVERISNLSISIDNASKGAKFFMIGFIKRIGVAAVISELYSDLMKYNSSYGSILIVLLSAVIFYFLVLFTFSGYSDMARGICCMLGMPLDDDCPYWFAPTTVGEYFDGFMRSVHRWMYDYKIVPITEMGIFGKRAAQIIATLLCCMFATAWLNISIVTYLASIPFTIVLCVELFVPLKEKFGKNKMTRFFASVATTVIMAFYWMSFRYGSIFEMIYDIELFINGKTTGYELMYVLAEIVNLRYLLTVLLAAALFFFARRVDLYRREFPYSKKRRRLDAFVGIVTVLIFAYMLVFYLAQYPQYALYPFGILK